jgi:hypothetical protein
MKKLIIIAIMILAGCATTTTDLSHYQTERLLQGRAKLVQFSQAHCDAIGAETQYVQGRQTAYGTTGAMGVSTIENLGHALAARKANSRIRQIDEELRRRGEAQ